MLQLQNIEDAKRKLLLCNSNIFNSNSNSFRYFLIKARINEFRHISNLEISFDHPVTVITGTNKVGKTSLFLLIACSHLEFKKYDSTKPETELRRHFWRDVLTFTTYESSTRNYSYQLFWRVGPNLREGEGKRLSTSQAWTGLGKYSRDDRRNSKIKDREVRLIDLERLLPARNFSNSLARKINGFPRTRISPEIEQAFAYILDIPSEIEIDMIGSHINKVAYLISYGGERYSSYNAASGEESLLNILRDIFEAPMNSLILIDEIEAGFHPSVQRKLSDVIQYVAWIHKKQFILTTHSPSILAAFPQVSRKYIDRKPDGTYVTVNRISVNAAFSKMDSIAYPLINLYCEDEEAAFIIGNLLIEINHTHKHFNRLINIVKSGPANIAKSDYETHKRIFPQMRKKMGYALVLDGDMLSNSNYSDYHENADEFSFFIFPHTAPEKFLVKSFLDTFPDNNELQTAYRDSDHHRLYTIMQNTGLAVDQNDARNKCWNSFKSTAEYSTLFTTFKSFILRTVNHFSGLSD